MKQISDDLSVSVVIPNFNGERLLKNNLKKVIFASQGAEIIVVDDASTDNSVKYIHDNFPQVRVVKHKTNQRFAAACNSGVKAAQGDIVILLNTDVVPLKGYIEPMIKHFADPKVFGVGCKEIIETDVGKVEQGRSGGGFKRGLMVHWRSQDQEDTDNTLWVFGGSGAFRKKIWMKLKGMDELFKPAYEEDRDISYRALKRGYKLIFEPKSVVNHQHETTNTRELGKNSMLIASYKNQMVMVWKNITHKPYLIQHLLWLPYHLVFTSIRSRGMFLKGLTQAIKLFPQIYHKRKIELKEGVIDDKSLLQAYKQI